MSSVKETRIETVNRQKGIRGRPSSVQRIVVKHSKIVSKPENRHSFAVSLRGRRRRRQCVSLKRFTGDGVHLLFVEGRNTVDMSVHFRGGAEEQRRNGFFLGEMAKVEAESAKWVWERWREGRSRHSRGCFVKCKVISFLFEELWRWHVAVLGEVWRGGCLAFCLNLVGVASFCTLTKLWLTTTMVTCI